MSMRKRFGFPRHLRSETARLHNKKFNPPFGHDNPNKCLLGKNYWDNYHDKDYDYQFNSWGFRGEDYEQYIGQSVNVCIGDSTTVNIGGRIKHSWPYLLGQYFDIPTLNFGIDNACFYNFGDVLEKTKDFFKVNKIFVLYNLFDHDQEKHPNSTVTILNNSKIDAKINILKKHCWIHGAYWQFDPPWTFFNDELSCLYEHFPAAHDYLKNVKFDRRDVDISVLLTQDSLRIEYFKLAGASWMPYEKFCELYLTNTDIFRFFDLKIDQQLIREFLTGYVNPTVKKILLTNRDGWHMSQLSNQYLADYFYKQTLIGIQG